MKTLKNFVSNLLTAKNTNTCELDAEHLNSYISEAKLTEKEHSEEKILRIPDVQFKSPRIEKEYAKLSTENPELYTLIQDCNDFTYRSFKKTLTLTMIFRTPEEQDYLYKDSAAYAKRKFKSPHQFWHAVDIRSFTFTKSEITEIENWLNETYTFNNYYKWTANCHEVGNNGMHFHVQFIKSN